MKRPELAESTGRLEFSERGVEEGGRVNSSIHKDIDIDVEGAGFIGRHDWSQLGDVGALDDEAVDLSEGARLEWDEGRDEV